MKFYQKNWFIWLCLILLPPVGVILLWTQKKYKPAFRVVLSIIFLFLFIIALSSGGTEEATSSKTTSNPKANISDSTAKHTETAKVSPTETVKEEKISFTNENIDLLLSNPKEYKGTNIEFTGKVFVNPERDKNYIYLQVFSDPKNLTGNIIVSYGDPNYFIEKDSYVKITGVVKGGASGINVFGALLNAPQVEAHSIEVIDYITAVSPTLKTLDLGQEINQHNIIIMLDKMEFAEDETRVYLTAKNESKSKAYIWTYSAKIIQNSKQYEQQYNFQADYPELQSEILSGVISEGIITFPALDKDQSFKFIIEGHCDDYTLKFDPFEFEINQ